MVVDNLTAQRALIHGEIVPYFQPLIVLRTGELSGFEILARWNHPKLGLITPDRFIPLAEEFGWIGILTQEMMRMAFGSVSLFPESTTLAINISPLQLRDLTLPGQILRASEHAGFQLNRVVIEITETAITANPTRALRIANELKAMGCSLSLDDFGTGYSSLQQLQSMPFDKLKVDRSFVSSMIERRESRKIVAAVVGLGQSLGLTTVAEGVETQEQAEMLHWLGCDLGQGWLYGRPVPAEKLAQAVSAERQPISLVALSQWKGISVSSLDAHPAQRLAHLQAVYDGSPVGLGFLDCSLRYVTLNRKLAEMNHGQVEEYLGNTVEEMIPAMFPQIEPYLRRALLGEPISGIPIQEPVNAGTQRTRIVSLQPALDEVGEVIGVSVAALDVTDQMQTLDALRDSEQHYRSMVDLNPNVLWAMDSEGRNLDTTARQDSPAGPAREPLLDRVWLDAVHPDDILGMMNAMAAMMQRGVPIDVEYRTRQPDRSWRWVRSRGSPKRDETGKIVSWYGSVEDVDDLKQTQVELQDTELMLQAVFNSADMKGGVPGG